MDIAELPKKEFPEWDQYLKASLSPQNLAQTSQWPGNFFIVTAKDAKGRMTGGIRVDVKNLWLGKQMWWIRTGVKRNGVDSDLLSYLISKAKQNHVVFIRFQSQQQRNETIKQCIQPRFLFHIKDPERTLMVDLTMTESELFESMHPKTRYNIRVAQKMGVAIEEGTIDDFFLLYQATNTRKEIRGYPKKYFEQLLNLSSPLSSKILVAKKGTEILSVNFLIGFGSTAFYVFGGSLGSNRELMAPHLLHWESIRRAKQEGYQWYDMGGISDTNPAWRGITRFKRSFAGPRTGTEIDSGKTYDIVIDRIWYHLFALMKRTLDRIRFR